MVNDSVGRAASGGESKLLGDKVDTGAEPEVAQRIRQLVKGALNRLRAGLEKAMSGRVGVADGGRDSRFRSIGL